MRIKKVIINNFRAFKHAEIGFDDFSCIIGKNDTGKSTILAVLEWFFDSNKELDENDFAAAGFDWYERKNPACSDVIAGETYKEETVKEFIYDDFNISVDVCFGDANLPNRTEESVFIFSNDYVSKDGDVSIRKYMRYPIENINHPYNGKLMGYCIKKRYFGKVGRPFSDCSIEELKTAYNEIGKNGNDLCKELHRLEEKCKSTKRGIALSAIKAQIHDEEAKIKEKISSELFDYYNSIGDRICDEQWMPFDDIESIEIHFGFTLPKFTLYTSKTPIKVYLNELFTPYNAVKVYKSIEEAKIHTTKKLSEYLNLDDENEDLHIKENEKIDLFTQNSLVFKQKDLPLSIPLKNRGEGLQLKIKNAVFRLLIEIQTNNQINTIFAFEEPETHLHPSAQIEMYKTIKALSENTSYQVIITTHSPYIVKELAIDKVEPIMVKQKSGCNESEIGKTGERVLPYVSMNEYNYIAFEEPSIEYHVELFGFIQQEIKKDPGGVDSWLFKNGSAKRTYDYYQIDSDTNQLIPNMKKGGYQHGFKTLPYCVRNQIDHPHDYNKQYSDRSVIKESIEILRNAINKLINVSRKIS